MADKLEFTGELVGGDGTKQQIKCEVEGGWATLWVLDMNGNPVTSVALDAFGGKTQCHLYLKKTEDDPTHSFEMEAG